MIEKTLAKRYATALLAVTNREGTVEETEATLIAVKQAYQTSDRFRSALSSPRISRAQKRAILRRIPAGSSKALHEFFDLLVDKNRAKLLPDIADMYDRLADAFKGIVRVQVRSAYALTGEQSGRLKADLDRITGKSCSLEASVDRALKGGMLIRMGDSVLDGTVTHRLKSLREKLHELQKR